MGNDSSHIRCLQYEAEEQQLEICHDKNIKPAVSGLCVIERPLVVVVKSATCETSSLDIKKWFLTESLFFFIALCTSSGRGITQFIFKNKT